MHMTEQDDLVSGETAMGYYFAKTLPLEFGETIGRVEAALAQEGFGVISRIDIRDALKSKIGVDFRPYVILGACNPKLAYEALRLEDKVGTMLPCNVVVQDAGRGQTEVADINPVASMTAIDNPELTKSAEEVAGKLRRVINAL